MINIGDAIGIVEHVASLVTSGVLSGSVPESRASGSCAVVLKEPLGVVLGIAPWNAPLILGLRAVAAAVAAGNTAILKVYHVLLLMSLGLLKLCHLLQAHNRS